MAKIKTRKWNRKHEFKQKKKTKSTKSHPAFIFGSRGTQRRFMIFTHSKTTDGTANVKMKYNIDPSDPSEIYMRPFHFIGKDTDFENPNKKYRIHKDDMSTVNKYKKNPYNKK